MPSRTAIVSFLLSLMVFVVSAASLRADGCSTLFLWRPGTCEGVDLSKPLETDRPDFTESPTTVGQGVLQVEGGYTFTYDREGDTRTTDHSFPETLFRLGMFADWFELRLDWNYEVQRTSTDGAVDNESGANDLNIGCKIALTPQDEMLPETGVILEMTVPSGGDDFTADRVLPGINYCFSWNLDKDEKWSLSGSTAFGGEADDVTNDPFTQFSQSLSLGHEFNDKVHVYVEWYVLSPLGADTNPAQDYINGGFAVLINKDVQWDIRAGAGLNEGADDFFAGAGLSIRYY
jgi:hypothetical protein